MTRTEVLVVGPDGELRTVKFRRQPDTRMLAGAIGIKGSRFIIQLVGDYFEVYESRSLRPMFGTEWTIG
uniref:hypothetical protein n=1 Tax=Phenylobacterium sp. TaxID=1871053 RepID=UPI00286ACEEF